MKTSATRTSVLCALFLAAGAAHAVEPVPFLAFDDPSALEAQLDNEWIASTKAYLAKHGMHDLKATSPKTRLAPTIITTDGVDHAEAQRIATRYFEAHVGCGALNGIRDGGKVWIVEGGFGYAGTPIRDFSIDKQHGSVRSSIGPSYNNPNALFDGSPSLWDRLVWEESMRRISMSKTR